MEPVHEHHGTEIEGIDCAVCGHDPVIVRAHDDIECPNCNESYSLVVRDGFALVESDGWIARVTFDPLDDLTNVVPG